MSCLCPHSLPNTPSRPLLVSTWGTTCMLPCMLHEMSRAMLGVVAMVANFGSTRHPWYGGSACRQGGTAWSPRTTCPEAPKPPRRWPASQPATPACPHPQLCSVAQPCAACLAWWLHSPLTPVWLRPGQAGLEPASKHEGGKRAGGHQPRAQKKPCVAHQLAVQYGDIGWSELPGELKEIISPQSVDPEHFGQAEHSVQAHCYQLVEQLSACLQPSFMPDTYQPDVPALLPPLTGSCMLLRKEFLREGPGYAPLTFYPRAGIKVHMDAHRLVCYLLVGAPPGSVDPGYVPLSLDQGPYPFRDHGPAPAVVPGRGRHLGRAPDLAGHKTGRGGPCRSRNKHCINPLHLMWVTRSQNRQMRLGRQ